MTQKTPISFDTFIITILRAFGAKKEVKRVYFRSGSTGTLTTDVDTYNGTAKNDLFTGTTVELTDKVRITDASTSDHDVLNLTATKSTVKMDVTNVEKININWDAYGTPDFNLENVRGATVEISSEKEGYLGNASFTNVDRNDIVIGKGVTKNVTLTKTVDSTVDAGNAKSLTITGANRDLTVNANNTETVSIAGTVDNLTLSATRATDVTVGAGRDASVTFGKDAKLTVTGGADYTFQSTADVELDIVTGNAFKTLTIAGDKAVNLKFAAQADLSGKEIINGDAITLKGNVTATGLDLSKVESTSITLAGTSAALTHVVKSGANIISEVDLAAAVVFSSGTKDTDTDTMTFTTKALNQAAGLDFIGSATTDFETVTIVADAKVVAGIDATITGKINAADLIVKSAVNDVELKLVAAKTVDASAVMGNLTITESATAGTSGQDMMIIGGQADNTIVFKSTVDGGTEVCDSTFIGSTTKDTNDHVTFATTVGEAVAIVNGGNNTVVAGGIIAGKGQLTVVAGSGDDTVTANAATTGTLSISLGNGKNLLNATGLTTGILEYTGGTGVDTVNVGTTTGIGGAKSSVTLNLGAGNNVANVTTLSGTGAIEKLLITALGGDDTVSLLAKVPASDATTIADNINIDLGTGTNTLKINSDISVMSATSSITGVNVIDIGAVVATAKVNATLLDGATVHVKATGGSAADLLKVAITDKNDTNVDFSNVTMSDAVGSDMAGLTIAGHATADNTIAGSQGNDTITLTTGKGKDTIIFAETAALNGSDTIVVFETGSDKLDFSAMTLEGTAGFTTAAAGTKAKLSDAKIIYVTEAFVTDALTTIAKGIDVTDAASVSSNTLIAVLEAGGAIELYSYVSNGAAAAIDATELILVGTLDSVGSVVAADFVIA